MRAILLVCLVLFPALAAAQPQRASDDVLDAMQIEALFEILQEEAVDSGLELGASMVPGRDLSGWERTLVRLNSPARLVPEFRDRFADALPEDQAPAILAYMTTDMGQQIVGLELSARTALNDPDIEAMVLEQFAALRRDGAPRAEAVEQFIAVNDLIESNVLGGLSANAAFLTGLRDGADIPDFMDNGDVMAEVWAQEPQLRAATENWVNAFVSLAYRPLSDAEFDAHVAFSQTVPGQAMNDALFDAFELVFTELSYDTGAALARLMDSEDL